jgi:hypothetical protein
MVSQRAVAQARQPNEGDRIRYSVKPTPVDRRIARVLSVRNDTLLLLITPSDTVAVALGAATRLEISTRSRNTRPGIRIGALVGFTWGFFTGWANGDNLAGSNEAKAVGWGAAAGVAGSLIGAAVGASIVTERWMLIPLGAIPGAPVFEVGDGRARIRLATSFLR